METVPSSFFVQPLPAHHIKTVWQHLRREYEEQKAEANANQVAVASVFLFGGQEIQVVNFGYAGPNLLVVNGLIENQTTTAYIHQSSLQVVFSKIEKDAKTQRQPIGFQNPETSDLTPA